MNPDVIDRLKSNPRARAPDPSSETQPMSRSRTIRLPHRRLYFLPLLFFIGLLIVMAAAWSAVSSPALASLLAIPVSTPTTLPERFWARAELPKAAYVPLAIPATPVPEPTLEISTEMPAPLVFADLVADTPAPEGETGAENLEEQSPEITYQGNKYILVDISEQHLYAYENGELLYSFVASTGMNSATAIGTFAIQSKIPNAYGSTWDIWMPNWMGIYWSGGLENGIHALPILPNGAILWEGFLGRPISYGCVVLGSYDSQLLYDWADYGTPVEIQW